jgi:hypothetical protein
MRKLLALVALLALGSAACGDSNDISEPLQEGADPGAGTTATTSGADEEIEPTPGEGALELSATLTGAAEKPEPGDPDGNGTAAITLDTAVNEICFQLSVSGIGGANAAHIHRGGADVAGPIAVELTAPAGGSSEGCTVAEAGLINQIAENPGGFYVNVHNAEYPKGAVRGQLAAA